MEKVSLPIKTKVAAWWMIVIGGIIILFGLLWLFVYLALRGYGAGWGIALWGILCFLAGSVFFIQPGYLLLETKKSGWYWTMWWYRAVILILIVIGTGIGVLAEVKLLIFYLLIVFITFLPPFILLLLDRKNFWKIAK